MRNACFFHAIGLVGVWLAVAQELNASPPPPPPPAKPAKVQRPFVTVKLTQQKDIRWELGSNFVHGMRLKSERGAATFAGLKAVDVAALDQKHRRDVGPPLGEKSVPGAELAKSPFAVWLKEFDDVELRSTNGYAYVVDQNVFTDLRLVHGTDAGELDQDGVVIGRVKLKEYDAVELARFLVSTGIVDANIHIIASITGSHYTSEAGDWFALHSDDPYWTNKDNLASYDFVLHIAKDGTIKLVNRQYLGQLLKEQPAQP